MRHALRTGCRLFHVDLSEVTDIDVSGIIALRRLGLILNEGDAAFDLHLGTAPPAGIRQICSAAVHGLTTAVP